MKSILASLSSPNEVTILARILGNGQRRFPTGLARYLLDLGFDDKDKARMHDLTVRNQKDALSLAEKGRTLRLRQGRYHAFDSQIKSTPCLKDQTKKTDHFLKYP